MQSSSVQKKLQMGHLFVLLTLLENQVYPMPAIDLIPCIGQYSFNIASIGIFKNWEDQQVLMVCSHVCNTQLM